MGGFFDEEEGHLPPRIGRASSLDWHDLRDGSRDDGSVAADDKDLRPPRRGEMPRRREEAAAVAGLVRGEEGWEPVPDHESRGSGLLRRNFLSIWSLLSIWHLHMLQCND